MPASAEGREIFFEIRHKRPARKRAAIDHFRDRAIEFRAERSVLCLQIQEWNFHEID